MEVFRHLQSLSLKFYDRNPIGRLINPRDERCRGAERNVLLRYCYGLQRCVYHCRYFYFMFTMNWKLHSSPECTAVSFLWYLPVSQKSQGNLSRCPYSIARINTFMQEHITGMLVDQKFNRKRSLIQNFQISMLRTVMPTSGPFSIMQYFYPGVDFIGAVAVGLIIWYAGRNALEGVVTVGTVMAFVQFNEMFWASHP